MLIEVHPCMGKFYAQIWDGKTLRHITDYAPSRKSAEALARAWLAEGVGKLRLVRRVNTKEAVSDG